MINIKSYLNDGASWQAQAVLAYIRANTSNALDITYNKELGNYAVQIEVGRYENCREQGYVFTIKFAGEDRETKERHFYQRNYAVYEHRNSDNIIVLISNTNTINTPDIDDMWRDKGNNPSSFDYDKAFEYDDIVRCGDYILSDMKDFIKEHLI